MAVEQTLAIVKPDAVRKKLVGEIISRLERAGFALVAMRMVHLTKAEAEGFYAVHRSKGFFPSLTEFMSSGECVPMILEAENAINKLRDLMGATDPAQAAPGTIRREFADSIGENIIHGSDGLETAAFEISYFFPGHELL